MLILTFGCAAVYSSASFCHSDLPGSLFWMWYQSISTGSSATAGPRRWAAAAVGAADGAALRTATPTCRGDDRATAIVLASLRIPWLASSMTMTQADLPRRDDDISSSAAYGAARACRRRPRPATGGGSGACAIVGRGRPRVRRGAGVAAPGRRIGERVDRDVGDEVVELARRLSDAHSRCRVAVAVKSTCVARRAQRQPKVSVRLRAMTSDHGAEPRAAGTGRGDDDRRTSRSRPACRCRPCRRSSTGGRTCRAATRRRVEAAIREHGYAPIGRSRRRVAAPGADLPRARERVGPRDRPRRRARRRASTSWPSSCPRCRAGGRPGRGWIEGRPRAAADRRHRRLLRPERVRCGRSSRTRGIPLVDRRPDRRAAPRHAVDRGDELERRPDRDAPPAGPGPPADRGHRRAVRASSAAGPALDGFRAAMDEAGVPVDPELISHGQFHVEEGIERGRALLALARSADGDLRRQ